MAKKKTLENPVYDSAFSLPKIEENTMLSYNPETGEVSEECNPFPAPPVVSLIPRPYITQPTRKVEECDPTPCAFALEGKAPMDLRDMLLKFGWDKIAQPVDTAPFDETQLALTDDELDDEDDRFNEAMASRPSALGDDGLTNIEREMIKQAEAKGMTANVDDFREWQALKDTPAFKQFLALSVEEQDKLISSLQPVAEPSAGSE